MFHRVYSDVRDVVLPRSLAALLYVGSRDAVFHRERVFYKVGSQLASLLKPSKQFHIQLLVVFGPVGLLSLQAASQSAS